MIYRMGVWSLCGQIPILCITLKTWEIIMEYSEFSFINPGKIIYQSKISEITKYKYEHTLIYMHIRYINHQNIFLNMLTPISGYWKDRASWHGLVTSELGSSCVSAITWKYMWNWLKTKLIISFKTWRENMGDKKLGWSVHL